MQNKLNVIILAAGQGTRMRSDRPKVLHTIGDKTLLEHVTLAATSLGASAIHVVYGHGGDQVKENLAHLQVQWVEQAEQLGTGHAVDQVMPFIAADELVLVLYGDVPLITRATLQALVAEAGENTLALLTAVVDKPSGYGRIVRDSSGVVQRIVEEKDARVEQRLIKEINTGILAVGSDLLRRWLRSLENNNSQGEYYLTDIIEKAVSQAIKIKTVAPGSQKEIEGINNKLQLAMLEREYQRRQTESLMEQGVTFKDPARFDLRGDIVVGKDVTIDVNVVIEGKVTLADRVTIGPNCHIKNSQIGKDVKFESNCVVDRAKVGDQCVIGPYARLRPDTELSVGVKIGNFVEIKKSIVGNGSKINHLSYVGDTIMGKDVNVGAGTITCNYDGAFKHRTVIGDDVFIGSNTQLVAPVEVGEGATIGAGSTITHDAPPKELTLSRSKQVTRSGWKRPKKN